MSTPIDAQDLRETLDARAQFDDTAALARLGSVKQRVRVVRRRRRAALAGVAAAVVAVTGGVATLLPGEREAGPSDRAFGDLTAPATLTSAGATYAFSQLITGEGDVRFTDALDEPYLVTWAGEGAGPVTITKVDGERPYTSVEDFRDFVAVGGGGKQTTQVAGQGRVALAVYTLDSPASGARVDMDGTPVVLRNVVPGFRGLGGVWGEPGQTDVTVTVTYPERTLELASFCTGAPGHDFHVDVEGQGTWGACDDEPSVNGPGDRAGFTDGIERPDGSRVEPGEEVTVHLWLSRKGSDEPVAGPLDGVRMGAAFYEAEPAAATIGEWPLTELREEAGHTWRLLRVTTTGEEAPRRQVRVPLSAADRPMLVVFTSGRGSGLVRSWVDGLEGGGYSNDAAGTFLGTVGPLDAGEHLLTLRATRATTFGVALYEQVD
jgi:hypothetical protein